MDSAVIGTGVGSGACRRVVLACGMCRSVVKVSWTLPEEPGQLTSNRGAQR